MKKLWVAVCLLSAGCASKSADIAPAYVSPLAYDGYTCEQLQQEAQRVSSMAAQAAGAQDKARKDDTVKTTIGVLLFWPVILANEGDGQNAAQLANLKGQMQAIEQANIRKNCGMQFRRQ